MLAAVAALASSETIKYSGNPYNSRSDVAKIANTVRFSKNDGSPLFGDIIFPDAAGTYPLVYFIGGLYGVIPEFEYSDIIKQMANKGYIFVYPTSLVDKNVDDWVGTYNWAVENINQIITDPSRNNTRPDISVDVTRQVTLSHSSGCEIAKAMANLYPTLFNGHYFMDPVLGDRDILLETVISNSPVNIDSTEWCKRCCTWHNANDPLWSAFQQ